jgi:type III pantothenate kinase
MVHHETLDDLSLEAGCEKILHQYSPASAILSSVRENRSALTEFLQQKTKLIEMSVSLKLPFQVRYETPETLGVDRLANAAAMNKHYGGRNVLTVDCGTCITYSVLQKGTFIGGAISPGVDMRLKALHHFTGRLPLYAPGEELSPVTGTSTEGSIRAGAETAAVLEVESMITQYCSDMADLVVILTGGGMRFFEQHLKRAIFAAPYLTLEGLHEILLLNEN